MREGITTSTKTRLLQRGCKTHKAGAVLAECGLDVGSLSESVDETNLAVEQRAGFHKVVYHLVSADLPVSVKESRAR